MEALTLLEATYTPAFGGNRDSDDPFSIVFRSPSVGWINRVRAQALSGYKIQADLKAAKTDEEVKAVSDAAEALAVEQDRFIREHLVAVNDLTVADPKLVEMVREAWEDSKGAPPECVLEVEFIFAFPALRREVYAVLSAAGDLSLEQGKG